MQDLDSNIIPILMLISALLISEFGFWYILGLPVENDFLVEENTLIAREILKWYIPNICHRYLHIFPIFEAINAVAIKFFFF